MATFTGDSGGASRFFFNVREQIDDADPVRYVAKASRAERDSGLDSCEIVMIELHQNKHSKNEVQSWESQAQKVRLLVDMGQSAPKVIGGYSSEDVTAWSTLLFGNNATGQFPMEGKSITVTETNLITESKTLSWWIRSLTNVYTADASSSTANGGSLAESAENYSPSVSFINVETVSLPGVGIVPSGTLWTISASAAFTKEIQPTNAAGRNKCRTCGGWQHNPGAALNRPNSTCFCETPDLEWIPSRQEPVRNPHPTIKPLALTRYLATLLLPPAEYAPRRLFVPFAGVASECIGAMQAGWEQVTGVELTAEYIPIAEARVKHWAEKPQQLELT
jgi:hypothetical protein